MAETGKHAHWNSSALLDKPTRHLMPKTIVVLRTTQVMPEYLWCVRIRLELPEFGREDARPSVGAEFLWPLSWQTAHEFHKHLRADEHFNTSSLVHEFEPSQRDIYPEALRCTWRIERLPRVQDRAFVAALSVVTHSQQVAISHRWQDAEALRGFWSHRFYLEAASRRSPRLACLPLVEVLGRDLVGQVLEQLLGSVYLTARLCGLSTTLDARLVCRTFNACVCDGMERTCHRILQVCRDLRTHEDLACAYEVRKTLTWNGVSSFRAMSELWLAMQRSALTQREAVHLWMRLQFNKPEGAHPPRAPNALQSMVCVHGEALGNGSGYGTRSEGRKRVRFRLGVPDSLVSVLRERGWTESDSPVSGSMCPGV